MTTKHLRVCLAIYTSSSLGSSVQYVFGTSYCHVGTIQECKISDGFCPRLSVADNLLLLKLRYRELWCLGFRHLFICQGYLDQETAK